MDRKIGVISEGLDEQSEKAQKELKQSNTFGAFLLTFTLLQYLRHCHFGREPSACSEGRQSSASSVADANVGGSYA